MKKETWDYKFYKYAVLTFLMLLGSINFNMLVKPAKIVAGGVNGLAVLMEAIWKFKPATTVFVVSSTILIIAFLLRQRKMAVSAVYASLIYPLFVKITASAVNLLEIQTSDLIVVSIFSGLIAGIVSGVSCKLGVSQGGIVLLSQSIHKTLKMPISQVSLFFNAVITICGGIIFGMNHVMYALIVLYTSKVVMDRIILGVSQKKMFYISTEEEEKVKKYISEQLKIGCTILNASGGYSKNRKSIIMTTISTHDYFKLKEEIHAIDANAFFIVTDCYQVEGGK